MGYQSGTAISPTDLLQKLAAFATSNNWVSDMSQADGTGWRLHMHKGAVYVNIKAAINTTSIAEYFANHTYGLTAGYGAWSLYCGDGFSSGSSWRDQSGGPKNADAPANTVGAGMDLPQGSISAYHFFSDDTGDNIVVVVEKSSGLFVHCGWGTSLVKVGSWTGGAYFFGSSAGVKVGMSQTADAPGRAQSAQTPCASGDGLTEAEPAAFLRADVDAFTGKWLSMGTTTAGGAHYTGKIVRSCVPTKGIAMNGLPSYSSYPGRLTSKMTGQSLMLPIRLLVDRDAGGYSFVGSVPSIFLCNACNKGYTPATVYPWGSDNYVVFPGPRENPSLGFAIRKV